MVGYIEPLPEGSTEKFEYANEIVGNAIPPNYLPSCKKGFEEAVNSGALLFVLSLHSGNFAVTCNTRSALSNMAMIQLEVECRLTPCSVV